MILLYHRIIFLSIGFLGIYKFFTFVFHSVFSVHHHSPLTFTSIAYRRQLVNRFFYVLRFAQKGLQCFMQNDGKRGGVHFWQKVEKIRFSAGPSNKFPEVILKIRTFPEVFFKIRTKFDTILSQMLYYYYRR